MHCAQQSMANPEGVMQNLDERRGAIGGAAGIADNAGVFRDHVVIDPHHQGRFQRFLGGNGHDHTVGPRLQMLIQLRDLAELPAGFDDIIDVKCFPGEFGRVSLRQDDEGITGYLHPVTLCQHFTRIHAMNAVELEGVGELLGTGQIIHGNHVVMPAQFRDSHHCAPNAPKPVNRNSWNTHLNLPCTLRKVSRVSVYTFRP